MTTYEYVPMMQAMVDSLKPFLEPGERIIYRGPFRWRDADHEVLSGFYEMFDLAQLAEENNFTIVHNFNHIAVIR